MRHLKYLRYIAIHKWFVMLACFRYGLYWRGIVHDWSKFLPSEWFAYANYFYGPTYSEAERGHAYHMLGYDPWPREEVKEAAFARAWLKHQHRSPHHWQHWVLRNDDGIIKVLEMPERCILEMLADWQGAGRAITGRSDGTPNWYAKNQHIMIFAPLTRARVAREIGLLMFPKPETQS